MGSPRCSPPSAPGAAAAAARHPLAPTAPRIPSERALGGCFSSTYITLAVAYSLLMLSVSCLLALRPGVANRFPRSGCIEERDSMGSMHGQHAQASEGAAAPEPCQCLLHTPLATWWLGAPLRRRWVPPQLIPAQNIRQWKCGCERAAVTRCWTRPAGGDALRRI